MFLVQKIMSIKNFLGDIISKIFSDFGSKIIALILGSAFTVGLIIKFKNFLFQFENVQIIYFFIFGIAFIFLSFFFIKKKIKRQQYHIPTRRTLHSGIELSDYDRQTKWYYKNNDQYYFIPLISHSQYSAEFIKFCGPFCEKCDHFLHISELSSNPKFFCVKCIKKYKVPKELLIDYDEKLLAYFKEEYRSGSLREEN